MRFYNSASKVSSESTFDLISSAIGMRAEAENKFYGGIKMMEDTFETIYMEWFLFNWLDKQKT